MSNPINKLTLTDLQRLRNKTVYSIPDNPSNKGFSAAQLKGKIADPILAVAEWVKNLSEEAFALGASVDGIDNGKVDKLTTSGQYVYAHLGSAQGELQVATTATGDTIAKRESDGRLKVATPSNDGDATTKAYVDTGLGGKVDKTSSANKVYITDDTGAQATVGYDDYVDGVFARRDEYGHIVVATPTSNTHATPRSYVNSEDATVLSTAKSYADSKVARANLVSILGEASTSLNGLMSATDKTRLDTLYALLGETSDADTVVDTINEVLAIFDQYPEGADLVSALAGKLDKSSVYNGLDSDDTTKALSAAKGKDLQTQITALDTNKANASNVYTKTEIDDMVDGFVFADIDDELDGESENAVQNAVVTEALAGKLGLDEYSGLAGVGFADAADSLSPYGENSGVNDNVSFAFQTSGGESDISSKAYLRALKGNSVAWNQLVNTTGTSETINGITFTNNGDGSWTISGTATSTIYKPLNTVTTIKTHKFLIKGANAQVGMYVYDKAVMNSSQIFTYNGNTVNNYVLFYIASGTDISTPITIIPQLVDLTILGKNYLSVLEFNRDYPLPYYAYNAGILLSSKSNGYKTVGYNACSGIFQIRPSDTLKRCLESEIMPAIAGQTYVLEKPTFEDYEYRHLQVVDENGTLIRQELKFKATAGTVEITLNANEHYLRVQYWYYASNHYQNVPSPATLNTCVHLKWDESRTGYEPYESKTYALPNVELRSAGEVYDELKPDGTLIRRVGVIDLETLTWTWQSANGRWYSSGLSALTKAPTSNNQKANIISNKYEILSFTDADTNSRGLAIATSGTLFLYTSNSTNQPSGYLYYELATPTEEQTANTFQELTDIDDFGTQEFLSSASIVIPQGNEFFYPVDYKAFIDSLGGREDIEYDASEIVSHTELEAEYDKAIEAKKYALRCALAAANGLAVDDTDCVDLTDVLWATASGYSGYTIAIQSVVKRPANSNTAPIILCTKYKSVKEDNVVGTDKSIAVSTGGVLLIHDSSAEPFNGKNTAMSGVLLAYAKA